MKKYYIIIALITGITFSSCKKQLEEKFNNPELTENASIPAFFASMLNNEKVRPSYYNVRTFLLQQPGIFSQTNTFSNSNTVYRHNDGYLGSFWKEFYHTNYDGDRDMTLNGVMALYRLMEKAYNEGSETASMEQYDSFMQAGKVVLIWHASQLVDMWGDIPYSEAGSLQTNSTASNAKFDDQAELYQSFVDDLTQAATYFSTAESTQAFTRYDIMLTGDADRWRRFANSLKIRLLMRMSFANESTAQEEVMEILNNASNYPLIDGDNHGNYSPANTDVLIHQLADNVLTLQSALTEGREYSAPDYLLNTVMLPADDPRIPILFDKFGDLAGNVFIPNKEYKAMPITTTQAVQERDWRLYSTWDSTTFLVNAQLPGILMTASEVNYLKAEAEQRWGSEDKAKTAYETALRQSVAFYYYLHNTNTAREYRKEPNPSAAAVDAFITDPHIRYDGSDTDKLAKIWTQKWAHFGFLQSPQAWSEYRRTKYPQLEFPTTGKVQGFTTPANRLVYPSVETAYNPHYSEVRGKDARDTKIFWDVK